MFTEVNEIRVFVNNMFVDVRKDSPGLLSNLLSKLSLLDLVVCLYRGRSELWCFYRAAVRKVGQTLR